MHVYRLRGTWLSHSIDCFVNTVLNVNLFQLKIKLVSKLASQVIIGDVDRLHFYIRLKRLFKKKA